MSETFSGNDVRADFDTGVVVKPSQVVSDAVITPPQVVVDAKVTPVEGQSKASPRKFHEPIRSFEGNAKPHQAFWRFVNAADSESGQVELELYGILSEFSWFGDEITPKMFKDQLYKVGNGAPILLKIDSPGGDVFAAAAMRSMLMDYPGEVTARVDGIAASAAVMVTMGAARVQIMDHAYMMIHDPAFGVMGYLDIGFLELLLEALNSIKEGILAVYSKRTGISEEELSQLMADELWMSARQAQARGFADEIVTGGVNTAKTNNGAFVNCFRNYAHVPPAIMRAYSSIAPRAAAEVSGNEQDLQSLRERVQTILNKEKK